MESLLWTYRELIREDWPTKVTVGSSSVPALFGKPISGWYHGDRETLTEEFPAIIIDPESMNLTYSAMHTQEKEYQWDIILFTRADDFDTSLSRINELYRLFERSARQQSHFWVFEPCIFNMQMFIDPQYLIDLNNEVGGDFENVLDPYLVTVQARFDGLWDDAHQDYAGFPASGPVAPTLSDTELYLSAYLLLFDTDPLTDPWASTSVTFTPRFGNATITTTTAEIIEDYRDGEVRPVRFMGDSMIKSVSYGYVKKGTALLRGAQVSIYGKEQEALHVFGPKGP